MDKEQLVREMNKEQLLKCRIEFTIRQLLGYGVILENNRRKKEAEVLVNTLLSESCKIILANPEQGRMIEPVNQEHHQYFYSVFGTEMNDLLEYLNEWNGYPITISYGKIQLGIVEAVDRIAEKILKII